MKATRASAIGYGNRYNFSKGSISPGPTQYNLKSDFSAVPGAKAFSFGIAREAYSKVFIKEAPPNDRTIPGPGQYASTALIGNQGAKFTMRPKTVNMQFKTTAMFTPGPGQYQVPQSVNEKGNYFVSKYKNSSATVINPARSVRFKEIPGISVSKQNPGPANYEPKLGMSPKGDYFISKLKNSGCRTFYHFDRSTKLTPFATETPGPGNYRLPSDFGHYESKNKPKVMARVQSV
jgi:hypothetical protein